MSTDEQGGASIEMVLLTPVLLCLLLLVVVGGRLVSARNDITYAAKVGARTASFERTSPMAETKARDAISETLAEQNVTCARLNVTIDTGQLHAGGQVTATLDCDVDLSVASLLGLPLTKSVRATFTEPVDEFIGAPS